MYVCIHIHIYISIFIYVHLFMCDFQIASANTLRTPVSLWQKLLGEVFGSTSFRRTERCVVPKQDVLRKNAPVQWWMPKLNCCKPEFVAQGGNCGLGDALPSADCVLKMLLLVAVIPLIAHVIFSGRRDIFQAVSCSHPWTGVLDLCLPVGGKDRSCFAQGESGVHAAHQWWRQP